MARKKKGFAGPNQRLIEALALVGLTTAALYRIRMTGMRGTNQASAGLGLVCGGISALWGYQAKQEPADIIARSAIAGLGGSLIATAMPANQLPVIGEKVPMVTEEGTRSLAASYQIGGGVPALVGEAIGTIKGALGFG